jgi:hypothetical protein
MNRDFDAVRIHQADLDHEIDMIRTERMLAIAQDHLAADGLLGRARQRTGRALIAAGTALVGGERTTFTTRRV